MTLIDVLSAGFVTALFVQVAQYLKEAYFKNSDRREISRLQALQFSAKLRELELGWLHYVTSIEIGERHGEAPSNLVSFSHADLLQYSDGIQMLSDELISKILDLHLHNSYFGNFVEFSEKSDFTEERKLEIKKLQAKYLSNRARELALEIREIYRLPSFEPLPMLFERGDRT